MRRSSWDGLHSWPLSHVAKGRRWAVAPAWVRGTSAVRKALGEVAAAVARLAAHPSALLDGLGHMLERCGGGVLIGAMCKLCQTVFDHLPEAALPVLGTLLEQP